MSTPSKHKVFSHTAKKISCCKCGTNLTKVFHATHNSNSMYKIGDNYLCNSTKCTTEHLSSSYDRFENESRNFTTKEEKEIALMRECGTGYVLKQKYGLDLE